MHDICAGKQNQSGNKKCVKIKKREQNNCRRKWLLPVRGEKEKNWFRTLAAQTAVVALWLSNCQLSSRWRNYAFTCPREETVIAVDMWIKYDWAWDCTGGSSCVGKCGSDKGCLPFGPFAPFTLAVVCAAPLSKKPCRCDSSWIKYGHPIVCFLGRGQEGASHMSLRGPESKQGPAWVSLMPTIWGCHTCWLPLDLCAFLIYFSPRVFYIRSNPFMGLKRSVLFL